ncbi:putative ArsR family transcriptional regulator [Crossiella equi]|uniref:ArsR family transcriptional regulator n=1 Tax=Crossiella equi TaxID=130796 RepID=A0ABS5AP31_9PSEU|nr:metalloregulator ArsR/SmtB family transcription factor [Crossiella equi]MBP2478339.1 putative ArsR family transcriptional regulator [Crossiella equi]
MKNVGTPQQRTASEADRSDGRTRQAVARLLLERGPMTAVEIAEELGLSAAAVRRHLDALLADKQVSTREASRRLPRGRGRPAKLFLLTEAGRAQFGHAYDDLAVAALRYLAEFGGEDAVRSFAERRIATLVDRHRDEVLSVSDPAARAQALAQALSSEGYAASTRRVGAGEQLCQHHCPVAHVAAEFPQLCEAETTAFAELLGSHVQRLATIARGDAVCTTHLPLTPVEISQNDPVPPTAGTTTTRPDPAVTPEPGQTARIPDGGEPA